MSPGYGSKRSPEGEAKRTCSEPRPGWLRRTSGDVARAAPNPARLTCSQLFFFFGGANLIFFTSSMISPFSTRPDTAEIAFTTFAYLRP